MNESITQNTMPPNESIKSSGFILGFLGLGLIGGSIAKAAHRVFPDCYILAYDPDQESLNQAKKDGILQEALPSVTNSLAQCDYLFLCAPVHFNIKYLKQLKTFLPTSCILTDVGSVKTDIYKAVQETGLDSQFIGGHPMVGSEKSGYLASKDRLLENAYYFLTPTPTVPEREVNRLSDFLDELGALTIRFTPEYHDWVTSAISHVPHIIAASLVTLVEGEDTEYGLFRKLAAGGFKDITRIASSSPTVWQHILLSNPDNILKQLTMFQESIEQIKTAILQKDENTLLSFFSRARDYRDSVPDNGVGVIPKNYEIYVDVIDQAGVLAVVTTLLGANSISIKNLGILHSREYEEGALKVTLYDENSAIKAAEILKKYNFSVFMR